MKKAVLISMFILIGQISVAAAASTLTCVSDPDYTKNDHQNYGLGLVDRLSGDCEDVDGRHFHADMLGFGPALKHGSITKFYINCGASSDDIEGVYDGVKASAALFLGLTGAVYYSGEKDMICTIKGIGYELGISATFKGELNIYKIND